MDVPTIAPIGGKDYPLTWVQFLDWFHSEQACRDYLGKLRWPDGLICPKCGVISQVHRVWFAAIWYITNQKHGVSALGLQRVLGLGSYETAWTMLHRGCAEQWYARTESCSRERLRSMRPILHSPTEPTRLVRWDVKATPRGLFWSSSAHHTKPAISGL